MARNIVVGAAQLGPISRLDSRTSAVDRMIKLMDEAKQQGVELIVFPELALTTFFPRWFIEDQVELDSFFEREMPNLETAPLFKKATELSMGFYLGFAELIEESGKKRPRVTKVARMMTRMMTRNLKEKVVKRVLAFRSRSGRVRGSVLGSTRRASSVPRTSRRFAA